MPIPSVSRNEYIVNSVTGNDQDEVALTALANGRFALAWTSNNGAAADDDVRYTLRLGNGDAVSTAFDDETLQADAVINEFRPAIAGLSDGRSVFVWEEQAATNEADIHALVRNADGSVLKSRFAVTTVTGVFSDDQVLAGVIGLGNGNFMVAFRDDGLGSVLRFAVSDIAGNIVVAPTTVSAGAVFGGFVNRPGMALLGNGNVVLTYATGVAGFEQQRFAIVNASGGIVRAETDFDTADAVVESAGGSVLALANGNFAVLVERDADANDIQGRLFSSSGSAIGNRFDISTGAANASPRGVGLADGRFMVVYGDGNDLFGQMMFAGGTKDGAQFTISNAAGNQTAPDIDVLPDGRAAVSWTSSQGGTQDVYAEIYDPRESGLNGSASGLDDDWHGTGFTDTVYAGAGADAIRGGGGGDFIYGEAGNDTLNGEAGADYLRGGSNDDTIDGGADADSWLSGELGVDTILGRQGGDRLDGGDGDDTMFGGEDGDYVTGGAGGDTIIGGIDTSASGGAGDAADTFLGGDAGNDTITGGGGNDRIDGGSGDDTLGGGNDADNITGGTEADTIAGDDGNDIFLGGGDGGDVVGGGNGDDRIDGGAGIDILDGDANADYITAGGEGDIARGGSGNDVIEGGAGADVLNGGEDSDSVYGGSENDTISGGTQSNETGGAGDLGDIWLGGDAGDDDIFGGAGNDRIDGGSGFDDLFGGNEADYITGGSEDDDIYGEDQGDTWLGGDGGADLIFGGPGADRIDGGAGNDDLFGDEDIDYITGGTENDTLDGGFGSDTLHGGAGLDTFEFSDDAHGNDFIGDWVAADDQLAIGAPGFGLPPIPLVANQLVVAAAPVANQAFGQFLYTTGTGQLSWDADGTGAGAAVNIARLFNGGVAVNTLALGDIDIFA